MTIKQLTTIVDQAMSLKLISQAYTEIASAKLKKIRDLVEKNRYFLDDLTRVHQVVKQIAAERHILQTKNNKTMRILITSNYHFYGDVNSNLIKFFITSTKNSPADQIIIGKTALEWLSGIKYTTPYEPFILHKDFPVLTELNTLVDKIKMYTQIIVYYSKMQSVIIQTPTFTDITQTAYLKNTNAQEVVPATKKKTGVNVFEPELTKILDFFESQVTNLLLQQTFLESELSRTASRLISMDQAQTNADTYILEQKRLLGQAKRLAFNNNLLQTYTALMSTKRENEY